jgi:hypothetical protein
MKASVIDYFGLIGNIPLQGPISPKFDGGFPIIHSSCPYYSEITGEFPLSYLVLVRNNRELGSRRNPFKSLSGDPGQAENGV